MEDGERVARTPTTTDAFNAAAEASRREMLDAIGPPPEQSRPELNPRALV
jgi:hypothetical protein